uniref:Uncharacterized protein n=2 Tax=Choreotrichia TaxID=141411 RepID=A0A7S3I0M7_9SPIT|mmetsp:Transcript_23433/g.29146  ORF Transcript_23433/g.29146 Transcript_23433/m.29146 type:complete len:159 (+) Transcript_23433:32-508(+)|eukprot:CAMPEP_0170470052 /NCGR_PEP_ID=MMETSP0123-20130129/12648_1 /TAXON_ID=182087 /ORGANISM="Favella ehrenbergii, Strain Fehren 1" /LENGTH=158 /DNA_ID=CAMNT_0010737067 /DNA_START=23 /DNA_END=499 /DNA_ORIENTATION=+
MKSFAFAGLTALALADKGSFPRDDSFHADCHVSAQFDGVSCDSLYALMDAEIRSWNSDTTSPAQGVYNLKEESVDDYIWSTRLTKNQKYTDDQLFEFSSNDTGCAVTGRSRSQSMSYYDYSVNFCNLWNVYNGLNLTSYSVGKCGYPAKDPASTCAKY